MYTCRYGKSVSLLVMSLLFPCFFAWNFRYFFCHCFMHVSFPVARMADTLIVRTDPLRFSRIWPKVDFVRRRPFRSLEKGTEASTVHSNSLGNNRKSGELPPCCLFVSPCKLELFSIYLHFQELHDTHTDR